MQPVVGSRDYHEINFKENCIISGVSYLAPLVYLESTNTLMIRSDLAMFCYEFLSYKVNLNQLNKDIAVRWSTGSQHPTKVFRDKLLKDITGTFNVLGNFQENFLKSDADKVIY